MTKLHFDYFLPIQELIELQLVGVLYDSFTNKTSNLNLVSTHMTYSKLRNCLYLDN